GGLGLRVWERTGSDFASWRLLAEDGDYHSSNSYGAAFAADGTLYTVAYDSNLRRYAKGYREKPTLVATRDGQYPYSVAVHPAGDRVAIGFTHDSTIVDIYDAVTLARRVAADTQNADNGDLSKVAWSADGARLYAGGGYSNKDGISLLRIWGR